MNQMKVLAVLLVLMPNPVATLAQVKELLLILSFCLPLRPFLELKLNTFQTE